jgi:multicomponent K+:H+ antiporter subunit D
LIITALSRTGSGWFWRPGERTLEMTPPLDKARVATVGLMIALSLLLALFAQPVMNYLNAAAELVYQPAGYVDAVLGDYTRHAVDVNNSGVTK